MTTSFNAKQQVPLLTNTIVTGLWNKRQYRVERLLGSGANGMVFYVTRVHAQNSPNEGRSFAMKLGVEAVDFQSEINALTSLEADRRQRMEGVGQKSARPFLLEADDVEIDGKRYPFYVMRYVPGVTLSEFLSKRGVDWFGVLGGKLLRRLKELHSGGWVFCDLKADNVLVHSDSEVELVDYGGLTRIGSSVRQYTEWYDRGYWNGGTRSADIGYDLFAFAVLMIHLYQGDQLKRYVRGSLPQIRHCSDLMDIVRACPKLAPYQQWLERAISGTFLTTEEAMREWARVSKNAYRIIGKAARPTPRWLKLSFAGSLLCVILILMYLLWVSKIGGLISLETAILLEDDRLLVADKCLIRG